MYKMINSGTIENKGVEFAFHATPVKTRKFEWTTNITLASNKNTVKSLTDGVDYYRISNAPFKVEIGAVVGKPYGVIMGTNYVYDKNGNKCVDSNGLYMSTSGNEDIGHIYPDFTGGWSNSFKWGNFDASFQFDFSKGGHFFSTTQMWGYYCGMFAETAANGVREKGIISDGVVYETGEKNTVTVSARDYYEGGFCGTYKTWVTGYDEEFLSLWRTNRGSQSVANYGSIDDLFKCRPSLLYPIFVNQWSGTVNDDKLLIGSVNTCVAARPFSMYGLPYSK